MQDKELWRGVVSRFYCTRLLDRAVNFLAPFSTTPFDIFGRPLFLGRRTRAAPGYVQTRRSDTAMATRASATPDSASKIPDPLLWTILSMDFHLGNIRESDDTATIDKSMVTLTMAASLPTQWEWDSRRDIAIVCLEDAWASSKWLIIGSVGPEAL